MPSGGERSEHRHRFPRHQRLKRQRLIRPLFDASRADVSSFRVGPLTVRYRTAPAGDVGVETPVQVGLAVDRRIGVKPARNRVKRVMREVFRVHQHGLVDLFSGTRSTLTIMLLYRGSEKGAAEAIRSTVPRALRRLHEQLSPTGELPALPEQPE